MTKSKLKNQPSWTAAITADPETFFKPADTEKYLTHLHEKLKCKNASLNTFEQYIRSVKNYLIFVQGSPERNDEPRVKEYLNYLKTEKNWSDSSLKSTHSALNFFYKYVINYVLDGRKIRKTKISNILLRKLSREEAICIIENTTNKKHQLILHLIYQFQLEIEDIGNLKIQDINLSQKILYIQSRKNKENFRINLDTLTVEKIVSHLSRFPTTSYVFLGKNMIHPLTSKYIKNLYPKACDRINISSLGGIQSLQYALLFDIQNN